MEGCRIVEPIWEPQDPVERIEKIILPELKEAIQKNDKILMKTAIIRLDCLMITLTRKYKLDLLPMSKRQFQIMKQLQEDFKPPKKHQQKKPKIKETQDLNNKEKKE